MGEFEIRKELHVVKPLILMESGQKGLTESCQGLGWGAKLGRKSKQREWRA